MSTSRGKPTEQDYFAGFSEPSAQAEREAPPAEVFFVDNEVTATATGGSWSKSNRAGSGTIIEHIVDLNAVAASPPDSEQQGEPVVRLPHAAQLSAVVGLPGVYAQPRPTNLMTSGSEAVDPETWTWVRTPPQTRFALSGAKIFLSVAAIAAPLAFMVFAFADLPYKHSITALWTRTPIHPRQAVAPIRDAQENPRAISAPPQVLPSQSEGRAASIRRESEPQIRNLPKQKIAAATNLNLGGEATRFEGTRLSEAQSGVWTRCTVDLIPSGEIAVQKAATYQACISVGKKCAGSRRYAEIQFFERPTLTSKVPLELCDTEF